MIITAGKIVRSKTIVSIEDDGIAAGYRISELGINPKDWQTKKLGEIASHVGSGKSKLVGTKNAFPVFGSTGIIGYSEEGDYEGDAILVARVGANAGKVNIVTGQYGVTDNTIILRLPAIYNINYFFKMLENQQLNRLIFGSGQPLITGSQLKNLSILIAPISEQQAIAAALSDIDSLITCFEKLIAKKRDIKQAVMQQFLSGKQRLPGFSGDWEIKRIGEIFDFLSTANNPRSDLSDHGEIGYIHYGDIHGSSSSFFNYSKKSMPYIDQLKVKNLPFLEKGDLVIADASEDYEGIGKSIEIQELNNKKVVAGLHTFLLRGNKSFLADGFKGYLQYIPSFRKDMVRLATGISVYGISKNNLRDIYIELPSIQEQKAIANILSNMDTEIFELEQQLTKTRNLKQGMMQVLLTGRIRLI